jgi:acyl-CoA dehydrogenase
VKAGRIEPHPSRDLSVLARDAGVISAEECALWQRKEALRRNVIKVDDFPQDYGRAEALQKLSSEKLAAVKAA